MRLSNYFKIFIFVVSEERNNIRTMFSKTLSLILLSLASLSNACNPGKHDNNHAHRNREENIRATTMHHNPLTDPNVIDPHCDCDSSGFGMVQTVPYCTTGTCGIIQVDLSSACVRCSMCMAIAGKVHEKLLSILYRRGNA